MKLSGVDDEDEWHENILKFIHRLKDSGKLTDYNQIAFLFSSVKHPKVKALADFWRKIKSMFIHLAPICSLKGTKCD